MAEIFGWLGLMVRSGARALMIGIVALAIGVASAQAQTSEPVPEDHTQSALQLLLEVLKDDAARTDLIQQLEAATAPATRAAVTEAEPADESMSLGRRIALVTQQIAQDTVQGLTSAWTQFQSGQGVFSGLSWDALVVLVKSLPELLLVILITVSVFLLLNYLARPIHKRLGRSVERAGLIRTVTLFVVSKVIDLLSVVLAWALGYVATIIAVGEFGTIGIRQTMFLNAFLLVESGKVVIRAVLSPDATGLRLVRVTDYAATKINRALGLVVSVLGYGQLLVVPIVGRSASVAAGAGMSALLSVLVLLFAIVMVIRNRAEVAGWLAGSDTDKSEAETDPEAPAARQSLAQALMGALAKSWHWLVLSYLGGMFIVVMTQPADVTFNALVGSGKILAALVLASLVSGWLSEATARGVALPADINQKLPLLEPRLNRFVPRAFGTLRLFLMVVVMFFVLDVIGMIDMRAWLESRLGLQITASILSVAVILLMAFAMWLALTSFVDYRLNPEFGSVPTSRETTLLTLMRNAATIALVILTLMFCLSEIGLDIGPLLASAGVLGLAIGFGAQSMVKDIITGIFIQFENAINVGDVITVGGVTGSVEKLSVRSVSLRDGQGVFHIIPFSSVDMVSNAMRDFSYSVCDMGIAYRENVDEAKQAMHDAFDMLMADPDFDGAILGPLEWMGITSFGDNAVMLRARIKTVPGRQWATGRAYNGYLKTVFDERDIEIPFPQQTIWLGQAKDGSTQRFQIDSASDGKPKPDKA